MTTSSRFGLSAALTTPFGADDSVDLARLSAHARWCLDQGCSSVTAFGTTGEGASLGLSARREILAALKEAGLDMRRHVVGGVAATSIEEAAAQTRLLLDADCRAVLLAPPFYFKGVSDDGLLAWFRALFEALGDGVRDVILYNIPSVTAVTITPDLVGRLRAIYPDAIVGVKDSSGSWESAEAFLAAHRDIAILIGDERHLAAAVGRGAEGAISGLANVVPERLLAMIETAQPDAYVSRVVDEVLKFPVTPAVKALVADRTGQESWRNVRPPLLPLPAAEAARLRTAVSAIGSAQAA